MKQCDPPCPTELCAEWSAVGMCACEKCGGHGWIQACDAPDGFEEPCECTAQGE